MTKVNSNARNKKRAKVRSEVWKVCDIRVRGKEQLAGFPGQYLEQIFRAGASRGTGMGGRRGILIGRYAQH